MKIESRANLMINIVGLSLILVSVVMKLLNDTTNILSLLRTFIYMIFFILWIITIRRRVIQTNIKLCLTAVAALELLWVVVRSVKYHFFREVTAMRYAWYIYYLPMLMIPALCMLLGISIGKPENHRFNKRLLLFPLISALLFLLVMTNDLHSAVFIIPYETLGVESLSVGNYSYGFLYAVIAAYIGLCTLASYGIILVKCRKPSKKLMRFLPIVPISLGFAVCLVNFLGVKRLFGFYQIDITVLTCFCATATLEACIQSGLILTNNGYEELFKMSSISVVIADGELSPLISSSSYKEIPKEIMKKAVKAPEMLENGCRLSCASIKHGYVLWQDDLSELSSVLSNLSETNDYLQGKSSAIQQAYDFQKKERRLIEKNRLYNRILTHTKPEIERYAELIEQIAAEPDDERAKALAVKAAFVGAFIKRRDNLVFLSEEGKLIDPSELAYCIEESLSNLGLGGAECALSSTIESPLEFGTISRLYEEFYRLMFALMDGIGSVYVYTSEERGEAVITMRISLKDGAPPPCAMGDNIRLEKEDDEWTVTICA